MHHRILITAGAFGLTTIIAGCGVSASQVSQAPSLSTRASTVPSATSTPSSGTASPSSPTVSTSISTTTTTGAPTSAAPVIMGMPGALETNAAWPIRGAKASNTGTPMSTEQFTRSGVMIDGVHWRWPTTDTNPQDYLIVPTVVGGKPYLVWAHLGAHTGGYNVSLDPSQPASLWMTPWTLSGGSLSSHATLISNDIPPVWSRSGQWTFASSQSTQSMAENTWTGWFHWGTVATPYTPTPGKPNTTPTVAWPSTLYPAPNGVVLVIETHLLGAAQGSSYNVYDLNLEQHTINGLASLSNGGGMFMGLGVWNGLILDGEGALNASGQIPSTVVAYNEVTGKRQPIKWTHGVPTFYDYELIGHRLLNSQGGLVATLSLSDSVLYGPTPNPF